MEIVKLFKNLALKLPEKLFLVQYAYSHGANCFFGSNEQLLKTVQFFAKFGLVKKLPKYFNNEVV